MVEAVLEMIFAVSIGRCRAARGFKRRADGTIRNVSTTLIQPGSEFKLGYDASIELRGAGRVRQRLVLAGAIRGSNRRRAWVRVPPTAAARSASARMRSLSFAVKLRRRGRADNSGDAAAGAGTTVGLRPPFVPSPAAASICLGSMGMTEIILPRPQV